MTLLNARNTAVEMDNAPVDSTSHEPSAATNDDNDSRANPDLQRAKELLDLHREVKSRHHHYYDAGGLNEELSRIRQEVSRVHAELETQRA